MELDDMAPEVAKEFYPQALAMLHESGLPFLMGGGFALRQYTGMQRDMKDMDVFCKAGDCPRLLKLFADEGFKTELVDARWLAKAFKDGKYVDFIFNNPGNNTPVNDGWFRKAPEGTEFGVPVKYISAEDLFRCKIYVQNRERYDGSDLNHLILRHGHLMDWERILQTLEQHWQLVLAQLLSFQFVYPSERDIIPRWLFDELLLRAKEQFDMPPPTERVCRGLLIDQTQYAPAVTEWGFKAMTIMTI
ncbi:nucleotidyltransferase [Rufibacter sp. LB8]|uniref:nucleotidyltransferase n=1 Tax=Rufibacter sp. LB8 TaxID=2777781 RepID=UPI00178C6F62|nr:nucleotidyltransferase [Rufibacter sp. LB8]